VRAALVGPEGGTVAAADVETVPNR
jgi:hypothetical protein